MVPTRCHLIQISCTTCCISRRLTTPKRGVSSKRRLTTQRRGTILSSTRYLFSLALLVSLFLSICLSLFLARYVFEPRHVHEWPKHHTHECVILPRRDSHVNICMSSIANMNEICHVHECMNKSCRTCEWATSYVWMSHATHTQIMKVCARASAVIPQ